jgi:hypothetical protein
VAWDSGVVVIPPVPMVAYRLGRGEKSGQLVAYADLEFCTKNFLVTLPQIFCMGKFLMALYVKRLFPYERPLAQG